MTHLSLTRTQRFWALSLMIGLLCSYSLWCNAPVSYAQTGGYSLRFYGSGVNDSDRVKIRIDPPVPANIGATDFTIDFWMRAGADDNPAAVRECGANDNWIYGHIIVDRDRFNRDRKFGLSIAGGRLIFGVTGAGDDKLTVCGTTNLLDGMWHHVAVQRQRTNGQIWLFVDGKLEAQADGPDGDISYPVGAPPGNFCNGLCVNDPYLVIAAEKHDYGPEYPSYSGWLDEMRLSNTLRYSEPFNRPTAPFTPDAATVALYHFDEGSGDIITDASNAAGGPSKGERRAGGSRGGPEWSTDTPFAVTAPTPASAAITAMSHVAVPTVFTAPTALASPGAVTTAPTSSLATPPVQSGPTAAPNGGSLWVVSALLGVGMLLIVGGVLFIRTRRS